MFSTKMKHRKLSSHPHSWLVMAFMFLVLSLGCTPESTPTEIVYPTSMASCFPESVFTAEDMRARVDCHPDEYKMEITQDTVILFAFPDPLLDWVGPIFIIHVPSVSEVVLNTDGTTSHEAYNSAEGRNAIENVLDDKALIGTILERAEEIEKK